MVVEPGWRTEMRAMSPAAGWPSMRISRDSGGSEAALAPNGREGLGVLPFGIHDSTTLPAREGGSESDCVTREQIRDAARRYLPLSDYARIAFVPGKAK